MYRDLAGATLAALAIGCAANPPASAISPSAPLVDGAVPDDLEPQAEDEISGRARRLLAGYGIPVDEYRLVFREEKQWTDSSLGCPRPGEMYTQALVSGQSLRFSNSKRTYEVHVAGDHAVLCPSRAEGNPKKARSIRARNLDVLIDQARMDLAQRLDVALGDVELENVAEASWMDAELGCADGSTAPGGQVLGYRLFLHAGGARHIYHTDLIRVIACPPIERH